MREHVCTEPANDYSGRRSVRGADHSLNTTKQPDRTDFPKAPHSRQAQRTSARKQQRKPAPVTLRRAKRLRQLGPGWGFAGDAEMRARTLEGKDIEEGDNGGEGELSSRKAGWGRSAHDVGRAPLQAMETTAAATRQPNTKREGCGVRAHQANTTESKDEARTMRCWASILMQAKRRAGSEEKAGHGEFVEAKARRRQGPGKKWNGTNDACLMKGRSVEAITENGASRGE
ncbi:hypothetical protein R3P38DRAFT_2792308 [Favolaschia claudopus]|uniref:Uncharacterized protein n=1 Tax=Favolaschia claudopus TaxID=2862362 RepID=A0AAW0AF32_9AGAR